jgi:hypothetical protein
MTTEEFEKILTFAPAAELVHFHQFRLWSRTDKIEGKFLYLINHAHWNVIPKGYKLYCINHQVEYFDPRRTDDDTRGGCIAYGVLREELP